MKIYSEERRHNMSLAKMGEKNHQWKGNKAGYEALHFWVKRRLGRPRVCDNCLNTEAKKYEWANISGEYKRELSDWKRLCTSCHQKMDGHRIKQWATQREKRRLYATQTK